MATTLGCFSSKPNLPALAGSGSVSFWCSEHLDMKEDFLERFTVLFNTFAEKMEVDALPSTDYALIEPESVNLT